MSACSALQAPLEPAGSPLFALASFERMPWVRTPEAPQETRPSCLLGFRLPHCGTGSATPTTVDFGVNYPIHLRSGLRSPCLRFAGVSPHHHARLGTRRLARLYRGSHLRLLNFYALSKAQPPRTRTCSIPASGSSVALASAQAETVTGPPPVCCSPQGGWLMLIQPDMSGMSFLCGLRTSVSSFPCTWLSHAPSTIPDKTPQWHPASFPFYSIPLPPWLMVPCMCLGSSPR